MKTLIFIFLFASIVLGQTTSNHFPTMSIGIEEENEYLIIALVNYWDEYVKANADTIEATKFKEDGYTLYIYTKNGIEWMDDEDGLKRNGYVYNNIFARDMVNNVFVIEYYFIKQPTIQGFIEFLRKKI